MPIPSQARNIRQFQADIMLTRTAVYQETASHAWDVTGAIVDGESHPTRRLICGAVIATKTVRWTATVKIVGSAIAA